MDYRLELQKEYFALTRKLNLSNRKKNQTTHLHFLTNKLSDGEVALFATVNFEFYLRIGIITLPSYLNIHHDFEYPTLANYIKLSIKNISNESEMNSTIRLAIDRLFAV